MFGGGSGGGGGGYHTGLAALTGKKADLMVLALSLLSQLEINDNLNWK